MNSGKGQRLVSWKAIARHLDRSVRTAKRWEAEEGLPVHRHQHQRQGRVYAYAGELEGWLSDRSDPPSRPSTPSRSRGDARGSAGQQSIAVLPFDYIGADRDNAYLADGFTDEIIGDLSHVHALRVISRTSMTTLRDTTLSAREIAEWLEVDYLLEGSVRQIEDRLKISVRLIDPRADDRIWAGRYDASTLEIFEVQERIARESVAAMAVTLTAEDERELGRRPIDDLEAWRCAMKARRAALEWRRESIDQAVAWLEEGLAATGDNVRLLATLGRAELQYREAGIELGDGPIERAEHCARRLFRLTSQSAEGLQLRGWIRYAQGLIAEAVSDLEASRSLDPNDPDTLALLANCYLISGRPSPARPLIDHLLSIDPLTPLNRCMPGWSAMLEGDFSAAVAPYREMFEMDPNNPIGRLFYLFILILTGRVDDANAVAAGFAEAAGNEAAPEVAQLLLAGARRNPDRLPDPSPHVARLARSNDFYPRFLAHAYAESGDAERAVAWLTVAVERGFINHPFLSRHEPALSRLAGHPGFDALMRTAGQRWRDFPAATRGP